jgi:hypothetical protein
MAFIPTIPGRRLLRLAKLCLPELNFITVHYFYFILTSLLSAMVFWGSSTPKFEVGFTDSLFLCVSAMTESGLNTVNLSEVNTWQQIILFLLTLIGSSIFVSSFIVYIRRRAFEKRFLTEMEREHRIGRRMIRTFSRGRSGSATDMRGTRISDKAILSSDHGEATVGSTQDKIHVVNEVHEPTAVVESPPITTLSPTFTAEELATAHQSILDGSAVQSDSEPRLDHVSFRDDTRFGSRTQSNEPQHSHRLFHVGGVGARSIATTHRYSIQSALGAPVLSDISTSVGDHRSVFSIDEKAKVGHEASGRNSTFHDLTYKERERLGGVEFKAVVFLSWLVPIYFIVFQFLGAISLGAFVAQYYSDVTRQNGLNPWLAHRSVVSGILIWF